MSNENLFLMQGEKISDKQGKVEFGIRAKWQRLIERFLTNESLFYTGPGWLGYGDGALESLPEDYDTGTNGTVIALGYQAMANMTQVKKSIAIGASAMENGTISRDNIAIGDSALKNVQAVTPDYSQTYLDGTRNTGIGGNAGYFITAGYNNTVIGRNAGQCLTGDYNFVAIGSNAYAGYGPIGLSGEIENWAPTISPTGENYSVAIGGQAMQAGVSNYCVAVGGESLLNNKKSTGNVAVGPQALRDLDTGTWYNGGAYTDISPDLDGTYSQNGSTLTIDITAHTLSVGDIALIRLLTGGSQTFSGDIVPVTVATVPSVDQFTVASPVSRTASGTARLYAKASVTQQAKNGENTVVGALAGYQMLTGIENVLMGYRSADAVTAATRNVAVGYRSLSSVTGSANCTAIGHDSLRFLTDGSLATGTSTNRTGLGYGTRVSGDNQVQLGNSATTTYAYGAVQDRSDIRDKADVRDTELGLDFILALRPVDFRWDYREDYEGEKDGSKKRTRFHHGLIAQEVQEVIANLGKDFGGYQDHSINGGCDVKSIGYPELIAPLIKAVQELSARVEELEGK